MFGKKTEVDPMYALQDRLSARDVSAGYEFLRLFKSRPDLDPVLHDLIRAVALVAADLIGEDDE
ncbi:MAG TPA: hypothetical protein VIG24_16495 [Acidimicrobiia bacterium]